MSRVRKKPDRVYSGSWDRIPSNIDESPTSGSVVYFQPGSACADVNHAPKPYERSDLVINHRKGSPATMSGRKLVLGDQVDFQNIPLPPDGAGEVVFTNWVSAESQVALRSRGPGSVVSIPIAVGELADLGRTMSILAGIRRGTSSFGEIYLLREWGLAPTLSDLIGLIELQRSIADNMRRIARTLRTKRVSGTLSDISHIVHPRQPSYLAYGGGGQVFVTVTQSAKIVYQKTWYEGVIDPQVDIPSWAKEYSPGQALGLDQSSASALETAWELTPWSWLFDYFANFGGLIATIGKKQLPLENVSLCNEYHIGYDVEPIPPSQLDYPIFSYTKGKEKKIVKLRHEVSKPVASIVVDPMLTPGQLSNITALAAALSGRRGRGPGQGSYHRGPRSW